MKYFFHPTDSLTEPADRLGVLLILLFFVVFPLHALSAGDPNTNIFISNPAQYNSTIEANEQNERRTALTDYVRKEALNWAPGLPDILRDPARWALSGFHSTRSLFDFGISTHDDDTQTAAASQPVAGLMQPPEDGADQWLASTAYHHLHGILPTHDALTAGAHARQQLFDQYIQYDLHPYYGQNYFSRQGYYATDLSLDFAAPANTAETTRPWGKLVIGYANGDGELIDHGRGIDLHGELRFNDNLSLNSGVRQSDPTGSSNYLLLQWKLATE